MRRSVRSLPTFVAAITILSMTAISACKSGDSQADGAKKAEDGKADAKADANVGPSGGEAGQPTPTNEKPSDAPPPADGGAVASPETNAPADGGTPPAAEAGEPAVDPIPGLLEQAKSLDTEDAAATKALDDAVAAGAAKLDVAKVANERGEALLTKGESDRAEPFFEWAAAAHNLYAEPVYNLAKLAAYAGDLDVAKQHLQELAKRGNKKLMKKVGVDPAFAPLQDDPDVRKIYEQ